MSFTRSVALAGHVVSLDADTEDGRTWLQWFFGDAASSTSTADLHVSIRTSSSAPAKGVDQAVRQGPTLRWENDNVLTVVHDLEARARVTDSLIEIDCPLDVVDPWRATRHLLFSALSWWFERRDLVLLHGAMIARHSDAALILGDTGQGKSTAAHAAQWSGWDLCSDDLVIVGIADDHLRAFGIPKRPAIEYAVAAHTGRSFEMLPDDDRMRVSLESTRLAVGWRALRMSVAVGHHAGDGAIEALEHADAVSSVLNAYLEADRPAAVSRQLKTLMMLAGLPAFELLHAVDVPTRLQRAADLIDLAWASATQHAHNQ